MKEILQTKSLSNKHQHLTSYLCNASFHVEHAVKEQLAIEGAEAEAEEVYQEEQPQYVGEDQEQTLEKDITNFVDTQGKHRFIINPVSLY